MRKTLGAARALIAMIVGTTLCPAFAAPLPAITTVDGSRDNTPRIRLSELAEAAPVGTGQEMLPGIECGDSNLFDNGDANQTGGVSHMDDPFWRSVLDDFIIDDDGATLTCYTSIGIWDTLPPGSGQGYYLAVWNHDSELDAGRGGPGEKLFELETFNYQEQATGREYVGRQEARSIVDIEPFTLQPGHYWLEMQIEIDVQQNYFQADRFYEADLFPENVPAWANYEDFGGLLPMRDIFGFDLEVSYALYGQGSPCAADLDHNGNVDFGDILLVLAAWGPCVHHSGCSADLDDSGTVDFRDLLEVLANWGPCP